MLKNKIPANELRLFLEKVTALSKEEIISQANINLTEAQLKLLDEMVSRRLANEPVAYILGCKEFYSLEFEVNKYVLIPRPETELIVDEAIKFLKTNPKANVLDLCCGSGCIGIAIAKNSQINLTGLDISDEAISTSKMNALKHLVNAKFEVSNWFDAIQSFQTKFDLIVCNPPYIAYEEKDLMSIETLEYEHRLALFSGETGYEAYEKIANKAKNYLKENGQIILECGYNQAEEIMSIFQKNDWELVKIVKDLQGFERCVIFK